MKPRPPLRSERGAFDLPSIIAGVVVVGILTVGVLATIFGIIPFAQDNGAKQDASAIRTAESVARAKDGRYMSSAELVAAGYLSSSTFSAAAAEADGSGFARVASVAKPTVDVNKDGTCYVAVVHSGTGALFHVTNTRPDPSELTPSTSQDCLDASQMQTITANAGGFAPKYIPAAPASVSGSVTANTTTANFSWAAVTDATGYRVESQIGTGAWTVVSANQTQTTAAVAGTSGQTVSVRVSSINAAGTSAPAQVMTVTIPLPTVSWTSQTSLGTGSWGTAAIATDGKKIAVTKNANIYTSTDSGATWTSHPGTYTALAVTPDGSKAVTAANLHPNFTTDYGKTWFDDSSLGSYSYNQFLMSADGLRTFAKAGSVTALRYNSSWSTSQQRGTAGSPCTAGNYMTPSGLAYTTACAGYFYSTGADPTGTWTSKPVAGMASLTSSAASSGLTYAIVGSSNGVVATSTDSGTTWKIQSSLPTGNWQKVSISDDGKRMVAARAGGYVYVSVDGGANWVQQTSFGTATNWVAANISADGSTAVVIPSTGAVQVGKLPASP